MGKDGVLKRHSPWEVLIVMIPTVLITTNRVVQLVKSKHS